MTDFAASGAPVMVAFIMMPIIAVIMVLVMIVGGGRYGDRGYHPHRHCPDRF